MRCVDLYNQTQSKWFEEMVTTCMVRRDQNPPVHVVLSSRLTVCVAPAGAGEAGGGADRVDPDAPASVHDPAARNRHVQPERESIGSVPDPCLPAA